MPAKGTSLTQEARFKISLANKKDYTKVHEKIQEYILNLTDDECPLIVSASLHAGISEGALLKYEARTTDNSIIRQLLAEIRDRQKQYLITMGLKGKTVPSLTLRLLETEHKLAPKPTNLTQNNNFNLSPELLAEAIEISRKK